MDGKISYHIVQIKYNTKLYLCYVAQSVSPRYTSCLSPHIIFPLSTIGA